MIKLSYDSVICGHIYYVKRMCSIYVWVHLFYFFFQFIQCWNHILAETLSFALR